MRQSQLFAKTTKTIPRDIKLISHKLLYQSGLIRESSAGRYYYLPLGLKVRDKIIRVIEEEMDKAGAQKLLTPVLHPLKLWQETNRANSVGFELMRIKDRSDNEFVLGGTAEEMMVDLVRKFSLSYKNLPFNIYQFSQKFRDELRPRGGLLRVREFLMKDAYSFHENESDFKREYKKMWDTYLLIFKRLDLETIVVEADNGYIGGDYCHEFVVESPVGESRFFVSDDNKYAAHEEVAKSTVAINKKTEPMKPLQEIEGKKIIGVQELAKFLNISIESATKTIIFETDKKQYIAAAIRGDYDINEIKLKHIAKINILKLASAETVKRLTGAEVGYAGLINLPKNIKIFIDESVNNRVNFEMGTNKTNFHAINVNFERDIPRPSCFYDFRLVKEGDKTNNDKKLSAKRGIEVGNIFQLGYHYSKKMQATFINKKGNKEYYYMGCYGIGIDRTLATIVEKHHDKNGIIWPKNTAPFQIHLVNLSKNNNFSSKIYTALQNEKLEVLYDDREESAGIKLKDADLLGIPVRLVISDKLNDKIEFKYRNSSEIKIFNFDEVIKNVQKYFR